MSTKERIRWRFTFREHVVEARQALREVDDVDKAIAPMTMLIDLMIKASDFHLFRSEDPVEAARYVVSDEVEAIWRCVLRRRGLMGLAQCIPRDIIRWEAPYGWSRMGFGSVSAQETTLAQVADLIIDVPAVWDDIAVAYLEALNQYDVLVPQRSRYTPDAREPTRVLKEWNALLSAKLQGGESAHHLNLITGHHVFVRRSA